jgi:hypothetical protein
MRLDRGVVTMALSWWMREWPLYPGHAQEGYICVLTPAEHPRREISQFIPRKRISFPTSVKNKCNVQYEWLSVFCLCDYYSPSIISTHGHLVVKLSQKICKQIINKREMMGWQRCSYKKEFWNLWYLSTYQLNIIKC